MIMGSNLYAYVAYVLAKSTIEDINTTHTILNSACDSLEKAELKKENFYLTTQFVSQVFYELRKNIQSTDIGDFSTLEFAALDIAAYIDAHNVYPRTCSARRYDEYSESVMKM
jgi:transcriptional regulator NrdR family protein